MAKPNCLVKISGNLLENVKVLSWLKEKSKEFSLVILIGGGEQINTAFMEKGFNIKFCTLGRVTETLVERQLARDVLENNQANIQDQLDWQGISARVIIPVMNIATVLCHVNGDVYVLAAYNGFDQIFILTGKRGVGKKRQWLEQLAKCFEHIEKGELDKIKVVGF